MKRVNTDSHLSIYGHEKENQLNEDNKSEVLFKISIDLLLSCCKQFFFIRTDTRNTDQWQQAEQSENSCSVFINYT